jgi:hypothetical protein
MNEQLATFFERLAGKAPAQRLLQRMGLDSRQFVTFLGLFRTLSERDELITAIGVNRFNLSYIALCTAAMGVLPWSFAVATGFWPARIYLLVNLSLTFALLVLTLAREAANALFNPVEASMLAHSPVHSRTYAAAKIAHVIIAVLYLVSGLTVYPALIGIFNNGARWFWPITHLAAAFLIGLWTAFVICALYGWMRRFVPANLLKRISICFQLLSLATFICVPIYFPLFLMSLLTGGFERTRWTWLPLTWFAEMGLMGCRRASWRLGLQGAISILASVLLVWFGLRSFSGTYFSETSSIMQGRARRPLEWRAFSRGYAAVFRAVTGSPLGLGAFFFVSKMMRRDWQFRRATLTQAWIPILIIAGVVLSIARSGLPPSPLSTNHDLSPADVVPHLLGLMAMALCVSITSTDFSSGSWIYLTTPIGNLREFAKGIYWALWIPTAGLPYLVMLPFMIRFWGWKEAGLVAGFSVVVVSLYLGLELKMISGLPFASPFKESRAMAYVIYIQMCWLSGLTIPATIQCSLFHLWRVALVAGILLAFLTWFVLRLNLGELAEEIRWRLHILKMGPNQIFKEIE